MDLQLIFSSDIALKKKKKKQFLVTFIWDHMMDFHGKKCKWFLIYADMGQRLQF